MGDFRINIESLKDKIASMLGYCELTDDPFVQYYFSRLTCLEEQLVEKYEGHITGLERKVLELEKEIMFSDLPEENYR